MQSTRLTPEPPHPNPLLLQSKEEREPIPVSRNVPRGDCFGILRVSARRARTNAESTCPWHPRRSFGLVPPPLGVGEVRRGPGAKRTVLIGSRVFRLRAAPRRALPMAALFGGPSVSNLPRHPRGEARKPGALRSEDRSMCTMGRPLWNSPCLSQKSTDKRWERLSMAHGKVSSGPLPRMRGRLGGGQTNLASLSWVECCEMTLLLPNQSASCTAAPNWSGCTSGKGRKIAAHVCRHPHT